MDNRDFDRAGQRIQWRMYGRIYQGTIAWQVGDMLAVNVDSREHAWPFPGLAGVKVENSEAL